MFIAGAAIQWLRDGLKIISSASETEAMAVSVEDNGGVYFVPAFVGLGAPHWDQYARGTMVGLTRGSTREHIVRAALESIAYQTSDVLRCMRDDSGIDLTELRVDGGAVRNDFLMQFQADILGIPVVRPGKHRDDRGRRGISGGACRRLLVGNKELSELWQREKTFDPNMSGSERERLLADWSRAVGRAASWIKDSEAKEAS